MPVCKLIAPVFDTLTGLLTSTGEPFDFVNYWTRDRLINLQSTYELRAGTGHSAGYLRLSELVTYLSDLIEKTDIVEKHTGTLDRYIKVAVEQDLPKWMGFFIYHLEGNTPAPIVHYMDVKYADGQLYVHEVAADVGTPDPEGNMEFRKLHTFYKRMKKYIDESKIIRFDRLYSDYWSNYGVHLNHLYLTVKRSGGASWLRVSHSSVSDPNSRSATTATVLTYVDMLRDPAKVEVKWRENYSVHIKGLVMDKSMLYEIKNHGWDFFGSMGRKILVANAADSDNPIYGVELELSTAYQLKALIDVIEPVWICGKSDSTITGKFATKVEMVTLPMSYRVHKKLWAKWFGALDMAKFDTSRSTNNGMHVHISREAFDNERHKRDFAWFFTAPMMHRFMTEISERGELNQWCPMPNIKSTEKEVHVRKNIVNLIGGQRGVINFGKSATIEIRLFKGIVSYATVMKNLELVDSVYYFTREGVPYSVNPLDLYLKWLSNTPDNKYEALKEFVFKTMDLEAAVSFARAHQLIAGCETVGKATQKLERSGVTLDEDCVEILNGHYKGKYFKFDPATNRVTAAERAKKLTKVIQDKGAISHLDASLITKALGNAR